MPPIPHGKPGFARLNRELSSVMGGNTIRRLTSQARGAYPRDLPNAVVQILEAGHFALDTAADEIAQHIREFHEVAEPP